MNATETSSAQARAKVEHFDVLIVGAGISGVGAAYHLAQQCPGARFVVLESKESFGGTWITHRFPGIRSDSDLYTFGYRFKPWIGAPIATAAEILKYMSEVVQRRQPLDHRRRAHRHRRDGEVHRGFPLPVPRLLSPCGRLQRPKAQSAW
jgi:cation diffusion facilitator CzcD-associated flavoprotein CzcO